MCRLRAILAAAQGLRADTEAACSSKSEGRNGKTKHNNGRASLFLQQRPPSPPQLIYRRAVIAGREQMPVAPPYAVERAKVGAMTPPGL